MKKASIAIIAVLCVALVALGVFFFQARGEITDLTNLVSERDSTITEKEKAIEALTTETEEKTGQIEELTASNEEKDSTIEGMTADAAEKDAQIEGLNADLAEKDSQIEGLNADLAERDSQIEGLNADLAEKDSQIEGLNADLADRDAAVQELQEKLDAQSYDNPAEDLTAVREGRYNNTKRFLLVLEEKELTYTVMNSDDRDIVSIPLKGTSDSGKVFHYTIKVFFDSDNEDAAIRIWNLIDYAPQNKAVVTSICNDLHETWRWVTFSADDSDNSVSAALDCALIDSPEMGTIVWESIVNFDDVVNTAYDSLYLYDT